MTTGSESVLLDTNVLVYALDEGSPHYDLSRAVVERAANFDARTVARNHGGVRRRVRLQIARIGSSSSSVPSS